MSNPATENYGWESGEAPGSSNYLNPVVRRLVRASGARTVLDARCGNGALCGELARDGLSVVGIDADRQGIEHAAATYPGATFAVESFENDASTLPDAPAGGFDCVVSTEVVEHLYAPHEFAQFCFDALRDDGGFIISTPYHGYLKNLALSIANKWDYHHWALWHGGHIKFWSRPTLTELLTRVGFEVTGFEGIGRLPYLWRSMILVAKKPSKK